MDCEVTIFLETNMFIDHYFCIRVTLETQTFLLIMPTEADFKIMDENHNGVLTMEEWKEVVGC